MGHAFDSIIATKMHNKTEGDRCVDIFMLKGDAIKVNEMVGRFFKTNRKMHHVRLIAM